VIGQLPDGTLLTSPALEAPNFVVVASGIPDSVSEIAEMLGWLVTAFTSSPVDRGITYYRPFISHVPESQLPREFATADGSIFNFYIRSRTHEVDDNVTQRNSQCWCNLFQNPVLVYGYPILRRPQHQPGLEIPLNVMMALLDEERINIFHNRLYIKGFNAMLVPTKSFDGLLLWHLLLNEDESHISYFDSKSVETDEMIHLSELEAHRHIVGWCSDVIYYAGEKFNDNADSLIC
jgi:hypothetical protein